VDEGEVCDGPSDDVAPGGCAFDCRSYCGNGTIEGPEVCDDGNREDGDGCASNCSSACGNGEVEEDETCDDGNDTSGDGCYQCRRVGDELWQSFETCDGGLSRGNDNTLLVSCWNDPEHLFVRYGLDGSRSDGPPPPLDPNEASNPPYLLAEQPSGDLYVVTQPMRNLTTANEPRVRVYRLQSEGTVVWARDLTAFPNGPREMVGALAVGEGSLAVAGSSAPRDATQFESYPYLALLTETGELSWKKLLTDLRYGSASAVELAPDGTVFAAGIWDIDVDTLLPSQAWISAFDAEGMELWTRTTPLGRIGTAPDLRLSGGELQILLEAVAQDDLVPQPPRLTSTVEIIALDSATGELTARRVLATKQTNGEQWRDIARTLPRGGFSDSESLDSYSYDTDAASGYGASGEEVFRSLSAPTSSVFSVRGALALGDLLCLNIVEDDSKLLSCYLTR
jgi:cysteine-rich repeat protein